MRLCVLEVHGPVVRDTNLPCRPDAFLAVIAPFRSDVIVGFECLFAGYWLADLCQKEKVPFVIGHAFYMKAIHGGKAKNDRIGADARVEALAAPAETGSRAVTWGCGQSPLMAVKQKGGKEMSPVFGPHAASPAPWRSTSPRCGRRGGPPTSSSGP
jgi:hypothetical protein